MSIGVGRLDAVLDAVEAGEEHRREGEVRVRGRVGAAELDPLRPRALRRERDAARRRAVALAVDEVHRRLVAGHQPLEAVGRRVGERDHRVRVVEQAADVPAGDVGQAGVAGLVEEQRLAALPQRLVRVHARAVVLEDRLRHERERLAGRPGRRLEDVLERHELVGHRQQRVEADADLALAAATPPRGGAARSRCRPRGG